MVKPSGAAEELGQIKVLDFLLYCRSLFTGMTISCNWSSRGDTSVEDCLTRKAERLSSKVLL